MEPLSLFFWLVRLLVSHQGSVRIEAVPFTATFPCDLPPRLSEGASSQDTPAAVVVVDDSHPCESQDVFLQRKTTNRAVYNQARARHRESKFLKFSF